MPYASGTTWSKPVLDSVRPQFMDLGSLPINYTLNDHPGILIMVARQTSFTYIRNISASRRTIYLM